MSVLAAIGIGILAFSTGAAGPLPISPFNGAPAAWRTVEFNLDPAVSPEPYDPDVCRLDARIDTPSGPVNMPGFWYQPHARQVADGVETLAPDGAPGWRVRFLPRERGRHGIRAVLTERGVETAVWEGPFEVGPASGDFTGIARVEPRNKRYFMIDDGSGPPRPLPLVGMNTCWHYNGGTLEYESWFAEMEEAGMNYARLWMWPLAFGIEVLADERLNYNQEKAWRLDRVLDLAQRHGIRIMLCLDFHGIFQAEPDVWKANDDWPRHPYNAANGGPCATQNEFFTNPAAQDLYRKRLRYLVGRYAAHPALLSWQFFNEINNVYTVLKPGDVVAWHDEMAKWLKTNDPYRHLVTTSFSGSSEFADMWRLDSLDYVQRHAYLEELETKTPPAETIARTAERDRAFGKPMYIGEYGVTWKGFKKEWDPYLRGMKQGVWAGIMCGTAGTAMSWWWERIHEERLYGMIGAVARFIKGKGFGSADWQPVPAPASEAIRAYAMSDGATTLLWLLDKRYEYPNNAAEPALPLEGCALELSLADGDYEITWHDTATGEPLHTEPGHAAGGVIQLAVPTFEADIACAILR